MQKKSVWKLTALILALVLVGFGVYRAYDYFLKRAYPIKYEDIVAQQAAKYEVEPALVYAVIRTESNFRPGVVSSAGAVGLMQLMPASFTWLQQRAGADSILPEDALTDPEANITYGVYFLSILLDTYEDERVALAAYNAGMGRVDRWLKDASLSSDGKTLERIPIDETSAYVENVLKSREMYQKLYFQ